MAKRQNKIDKIEIIGAEIISPKSKKREAKKSHKLLTDYGSENGKPRHSKGSMIELTEAQEIIFKNLKYIK